MKKYKILLSVLFLFFITPSFALDYLYKKLDSGQTVIVKEIKDNPIVTINTWIKTGSINEDDTNTGVAHFLEHLFFKGSKNVPTGEFDRILESKGAITNAATSNDYTQFYITLPSNEFDLALKLHSDMLLNPLIPSDELEKERFVVLEEMSRSIDNPSNNMWQNLMKLIYTTNNDHPYKRRVLGSKEVISTIPREKILEFYNEWYTPNNMVTVVSGDVDPKYALDKIEQAFKKESIKTFNKKTCPKINPIDKNIATTEYKDIGQGYLAIAYKAPKFTNTKETFALDILSVILGGSSSSILNTELKEKQQLVNSIGSSYSQFYDDGLFIISANFEKNKSADKIQKEIYNEIEKVKTGLITKEDIQKAKNILKSNTEYSRESAENIAYELGFFTMFYNTPKMYGEYLKEIDKIQLQDVINAAKKFLNNEKTAVSIVLPKDYQEISYIKETYAAAAKITPEPAIKIEAEKNIVKYKLENGSTLILQKSDRNAIVAVDICANGGSFIEEKPGTAYLAAANILRGTENKTREDISRYLDDNGIKVSASNNKDAFNISLLTTKDKLKEAFGFLDEIVNKQVFSLVEINKTKKQYKDYVNSMKDKPLSLALDELYAEAYKNYPYSNNSKKIMQYIDDISKEDIKNYYNKILDSKNLIISVVGNVDENKIIKEFNKIFQDKDFNKINVKNYIKESYIPNEAFYKKIDNQGKETTWIVAGYKTGNIYNLKELATLRVINSLLGRGMSSRMFRNLRENKGLAYQVGTQISQYANDSLIFGYIGTNPKNEIEALNGLIDEFNKLKKEFVSENELKEAKDKLLGNMILALETNMDIASFLASYSVYGYDLNFLDELKKEIESVTSSDILSYSNKYFSKPAFEVIIGK